MSHVLLLRAPSDVALDGNIGNGNGVANGNARRGSPEDPYEAQLAPATSVPVYETVQTLDELQWILETGPGFHGYKGVIVTSKRSVDAWAAAARNVPPPADERAYWTDVPFYAVGAATASAVRDLSDALSSASHLVPREVLGAEEAGTSEQLAHFILARLTAQREAESSSTPPSAPGSFSSTNITLNGSSASTDNLGIFASADGQGKERDQAQRSPTTPRWKRALRRPTKLLFLVGDKTSDALPTLLSADENIELDSVQVYATKPSPHFSSALRNAILAQPKVKIWWIAIFAPSGADYALPFLREHFTLSEPGQSPKKKKKAKNSPPVARIAAIGPTTAAHLHDTLKLDVAAVAAKPNAEELAAAIKAAK